MSHSCDLQASSSLCAWWRPQRSRARRWFCLARRPWHVLFSPNCTCAFNQLVSRGEPLLIEMSLAQPARTGPRRLHIQGTPLKSSWVQPSSAPHPSPRMGFCCAAGQSRTWFSCRNSLQFLSHSLVGTPVPLLHQTSPTPPAAIAGRKFRVCSSGESSVSKQSSFQNGTKQRQSFPCELEFNNFESLNSAQLDKIKMFCPDFNYPLLLNYFIYITVYYAQAFWCFDHFLPFSFCENEVSSQSTHFHKLFCFQQFGIFNRKEKKKSVWKPAALANAAGGASFIQNAISTGSLFLVLAVMRLKIQPCFEAIPWGSTLIASLWLQINYKTL